MTGIQDIPLTSANLDDIVCCPGGAEISDKELKGDLQKTLHWREKMIEEGLMGFLSYKGDEPKGFIEFMPAESAPFPIECPEGVVVMCYHWVVGEDDQDHLEQEKRLIELVEDYIEGKYSGMAFLAWDNPVHFPIDMMKELGFETIESYDHIEMMWLPVEEDAEKPTLVDNDFSPGDLSEEGKLAIEQAYSHRCPYSIHHKVRVKEVLDEIGPDDRIIYNKYVIDTHEDALKYSVEPWNWEWLYINGEEVPLFNTTSEDLKQMILDKLDGL